MSLSRSPDQYLLYIYQQYVNLI